MKFRTVLILLMLTGVCAFAIVNWAAFAAPTALSLGFFEFQAPLGLMMLVLTGAVTGVLLVYILMQQAGVILEARRYAKELSAHRELADKAEASRFTELRAFLETELRRIEAQNAANAREVAARIDLLRNGPKQVSHS